MGSGTRQNAFMVNRQNERFNQIQISADVLNQVCVIP